MEVSEVSDIRIAGIVKESIVDGPGIRYVVFTQGCPHHCPGCHNPQTHDPDKGYLYSIEKIFAEVKQNPLLSGITLSGGEPFLQAEQLIELAKCVKSINLSVIAYTGYLFEDLIKNNDDSVRKLLKLVDVLIDGKFDENLKSEELRFCGSSNQRLIDVKRSLESEEIVIADI